MHGKLLLFMLVYPVSSADGFWVHYFTASWFTFLLMFLVINFSLNASDIISNDFKWRVIFSV